MKGCSVKQHTPSVHGQLSPEHKKAFTELGTNWTEVDFSKEFNGWDIIFLLEDGKIYCMKALLAAQSPVFRHMFELKYKENSEIPLTGKVFSEMQLLFQCLKPTSKPHEIDEEDLFLLLHLACEYQIEHLRQRCIEQMNATWPHRPEKYLSALIAGFKYHADSLVQRFLPLAKQRPLSHILMHRDELPADIMEHMLVEKLHDVSLVELQQYKDSLGSDKYTSVLYSRLLAAERQVERLQNQLALLQLQLPHKG